MRKSIIIALIALCAAPLAQAQTEGSKESPEKGAPAASSNASGSFTPLRLNAREAYEVLKKLKDAPDTPIRFEPDRQSPVTIKNAKVRSATHEASGVTHHLIAPQIELVNETDRAVTAVRLELALADEESKSLGHTFRAFIKPGESKLLGGGAEYSPAFMLAPGSAERLKVSVVGVEFGSIRVWGLLPASPEMILIDTAVDKKPVLLKRPHPNYTERARA